MTLAMSWDEWAQHDAVALAERLRKKDVTPAELARQVQAGIAATNPALSAVIEVFEDMVADPAKDGMNPAGFFAGQPYLMKDLGPTLQGRKQEMGSLLMQGNVAKADTYLTSRIRQAGFNIMARTTTPEYGVCSSAENPALYVTRNPWNTDYSIGGSSAGSAAMVAAGVVPLAHGSDGGGSIRIPAAMGGNIGLKPSRGVFSVAPAGSDLLGVVAVQGCNSRSVRDTAHFVDACRGGAPGEFMPFWKPDEPYAQLIQRDPGKLRIALSHEWGDFSATPEVVAELERAGKFFESLGHHVEWAKPAIDYRAGFEAQATCYATNFAQSIDSLLKQRGMTTPPEGLIEPMNIKVWEAGINASYADRQQMQLIFNSISRGFGAFFEEWDIILTPVTADVTTRVGTTKYLSRTDTGENAHDWFLTLWSYFSYTPLANLAGIPGLSIPFGQFANGLPMGIQALGAQGNDGLLLQFAAQVERALEGQWNGGRKPAVHVTKG